MKRLLPTLVVLALAMGVLAVPAAADPPGESGIVDRFEIAGTALIPDEATGLFAIIGAESLAAFCADGEAFGDMLWLDIPAGEDVTKILLKDFTAPAFVVPLMPPPVLCATRPLEIASGIVKLKILDNDFHFSDTNRKNSYGYSAAGKMTGPDGQQFQFSGHIHRLFDKDDTEPTIVTAKVHLVPVGK
jgi:hypothetical protein